MVDQVMRTAADADADEDMRRTLVMEARGMSTRNLFSAQLQGARVSAIDAFAYFVRRHALPTRN